MRYFLLIILAIGFISLYINNLQALPSQVIIIRCSEKNEDGTLQQFGLSRAGALSTYLIGDSFITYGPPIALIAARPEQDFSCIQTLTPLAQLLKMPIHAGYGRGQENLLSEQLLNRTLYANKSVVVCWHHDRIGFLAKALGVISDFEEYPDYVFDQTWLITFETGANLQILHQRLMFGDLD